MSQDTGRNTANSNTLELIFIGLVGFAVVAAIIAALTYDFVSARTPLFILVPLLILIGVQINRSSRKTDAGTVMSGLSSVVRGNNKKFNTAAGLLGWTMLLMLLMRLVGHYVGIATFMYILLNVISKESKILSASISIGVTVIIYVLFEHGFNIEMYRGLFFELLSGYVLT